MIAASAEAAKTPDGDCSRDGHTWQVTSFVGQPATRFCLRCYDKQEAMFGPDVEHTTVLTTHGCGEDRVGHSWIRTNARDRRCDACGEQRSFIDTPDNRGWVTWLAIGGTLRTPTCRIDGHDWQLGIGAPGIVRHCRRCGDRQEAIPETPTPGCTRIEGHDWLPAEGDGGYADGDNARCVSCGLERFRDADADWSIWVAADGKATIHPVKPSPVLPDSDPDHERVRRPDPPGKPPRDEPRGTLSDPIDGFEDEASRRSAITPEEAGLTDLPPRTIGVEVLGDHAIVTKPPHYQGLDGTDILDMFANFEMTTHHRCAAIEYIMRAGKKGNVVDEVSDLKKAVEHLCRDIEARTGAPFTRVGRSS